MSNPCVYRYDLDARKWGFVPVTGVDMKGEWMKIPVETWTLSTGKAAVVYCFVYNQEKRVDTVMPLFEVVEDGDLSICRVSRDVREHEFIVDLMCPQHTLGCEPRYGYFSLGSDPSLSWSGITRGMKENAYISVKETTARSIVDPLLKCISHPARDVH